MSTIATNDKIFVQEALNAFTAGLAPLNAFTRSYSSEARRKGDVIAIPRADALSTTTFAYANNSGYPYETEGGTLNTISLNLDQHQIVGVDITDIQFNKDVLWLVSVSKTSSRWFLSLTLVQPLQLQFPSLILVLPNFAMLVKLWLIAK